MRTCDHCGGPAGEKYDYHNGKRVSSIYYCSAQHRAFLVRRVTPRALRRPPKRRK